MATGIAQIAEDTRQIPPNRRELYDNKDEVMLRIEVGPGNYLIFGRAVVWIETAPRRLPEGG